MGAAMPVDDDEFGDLNELCAKLDHNTAEFVRLAKTLYSRSLGAWCVVEAMSDDWMRALADALAVHHPQVADEPYFAECFSQGVEERHAAHQVPPRTSPAYPSCRQPRKPVAALAARPRRGAGRARRKRPGSLA